MISKNISIRFFHHCFILFNLINLSNIAACEIPEFDGAIVDGLFSSSNEMRDFSNKIKKFLDASLEYEACIDKPDSTIKQRKFIADKFNQELDFFNLTSPISKECTIKANDKGALIVDEPSKVERFQNKLSSLIKSSKKENLADKLRSFIKNNRKAIESGCSTRYIFFTQVSDKLSRIGFCEPAEKFLVIPKEIVKSSSKPKNSMGIQMKKILSIEEIIYACKKIGIPISIKDSLPIIDKAFSFSTENDLRILEEEIDELSESIRVLTKNNESLEEQLLKKPIENTTKNIDDLNRIPELEFEIEKQTREIKILESVNNTKDQTISKLETKLSQVVIDNQKLQIELGIFQNSNIEKDSIIEDYKTDVEKLNTDVEKLNTEIENLNTELDKKTFINYLGTFFNKSSNALYYFIFFVLLIPIAILINFLLEKNRIEELSNLAHDRIDISEKDPSDQFKNFWAQENGNKVLKSSLKRNKVYKPPAKGTYFFIEGFLKRFLEMNMIDSNENDRCLLYVISEIYGEKVTKELLQKRFEIDSISRESFLHGYESLKSTIKT